MANVTPALRRRQQALFLRDFKVWGSVKRGAEAAGVHRRTVYFWLEDYPKFKDLYDHALEESTDGLEDEARRRAVEGVVKPTFYKGEKIPDGGVREFSDPLLMILLRSRRPEKYRDRHEVTGKDGKPLFAEPREMSDEEINAELALIAKAFMAHKEP